MHSAHTKVNISSVDQIDLCFGQRVAWNYIYSAFILSVPTSLMNLVNLLEFRYDGLGPGEIPSLPRIIPKILLITFQFCSQEQAQTGSGTITRQTLYY